jgi:transforming growth factor-beta-induced protein
MKRTSFSLRITAGIVGVGLALSVAGLGGTANAAKKTTKKKAAAPKAAPKAAPATTAAPAPAAAPKDIVDTAVAAGSFKTLVSAVQAAGLVDTLKGAGPFTVFAPTDAAFNNVPKAVLDAVLADKKQLTSVLTYHVIAGKVTAADVVKLDGKSAKTVNGADISIKVKDGKVILNDTVMVTATDIMATNGVIHVIDAVLLPPAAAPAAAAPAAATTGDIVQTATAAGSFKTLLAAATAAGLVDTLKGAGPFTVFAPTDEAFAKLPKATLDAVLADKKLLTSILTYHVVAGKVPASEVVKLDGKSASTVNGATVSIAIKDGKVILNGTVNVIKTDVLASNGIIHVIDTVLIPPTSSTPAAAPAAAAPAAAAVSGNIVDVAKANGSFKTLLAAVDAAGLTSTLQGAGPFTVFAPTDQAFNVLPKETIATLLKPENKALLTSILTYHVVPGKVTAAEVLKRHDLKTVNGKLVTIRVANGLAYIGGAQILITDVPASNGVIHVIDTVLIP